MNRSQTLLRILLLALLVDAAVPVMKPATNQLRFHLERWADSPGECQSGATTRRDVTLNARSWRELVQINATVNEQIKPMTDQDHYGALEKWAYPDDGYGDCEDYVLLKRRLLMAAGWPRHGAKGLQSLIRTRPCKRLPREYSLKMQVLDFGS